MTFLWQEWLWLLVLVPIFAGLYIWSLRRKRKGALRYANLALVKQAMDRGIGWRRHLPPALLLIAITILILAVARPAAVVTLASSRATVLLAMDVSGSMRAEDVDPNRIVAAQIAAKAFIRSQPADVQIGIVAFASAAVLVAPPTIDREALYAAIDRFDLRRGTAVGHGILVSLATIFPDQEFDLEGMGDPRDRLGAPSRRSGELDARSLDAASDPVAEHVPVEPGSYQPALVILLTDGATTTGPDPVEAAKLAADFGVRVYTVGFGSPTGDIVNFGGRSMRAQLDEEALKAIADITKAEYFAARSSEDLTTVYNSLATQLINEKKLTEIAFIFAGIGALFAVLAGALSMWWSGRLV
jgi:Ca-activated chloride channel family protein